jgi:hypothetical protein
VGTVVVEHQVGIRIGGNSSIDPFQEIQKLDRTVASIALTENVACGNIERSEQAGNAVPLVVVGASLQRSDPHGQNRLCTAKSLNLRFLIDALDQRVMRRIEIQSNNIPHLVDRHGIVGKLES